ncbi:NAD(P)H-dependent oxidoreductase [Ancylobacter sp. MQZ15Z-1]|uniref:FMN dependent NADH:quinone oxidoreductase n=1 Tax=Ancylobacter mangrovi TaxID=2972472 RepID=A0A9X2PBT1_9HYPH|nr:NAD(P)H-dependent oxidoreductase [Ancylobacter mangrovi]MCS0495746.1 NAD(P)H-dependent oxidoreductase [Ancylobacter mangrovi]
MKLLHIDSSIQADSSASRAITSEIVKQFRARDPGLEIDYRDLAAAPLPHLSFAGLATPEAQAVLEDFLAADIVVIGAPMYNFTISSQLKAWLDHILIAGRTFSYGPEGVTGLAGGKRVVVALSRGGLYSEGMPGAANEHAETYLRAVLGFIGIADPEFIVAEGVALGPDQRQAALEAALARSAPVAGSVLARAA